MEEKKEMTRDNLLTCLLRPQVKRNSPPIFYHFSTQAWNHSHITSRQCKEDFYLHKTAVLVQGVDHICTAVGKDRERLMAADRLSANICGRNNNMKRGAEERVIGNGSLTACSLTPPCPFSSFSAGYIGSQPKI